MSAEVDNMIMEATVEEMEVTPQPQTAQVVVDSGDDVTMEQALGASPGAAEQGVVPDEEVLIIQSCEDDSAGFDGFNGSPLDKANGEVPHEEVLREEVLREEVPHVEEMDEEIQLVEEDMVLQPGRQYPIEVVLSPPLDPDSYERIPPSWTVEYIIDEVETGDDVFYSVEFGDGFIDQVAYDDLLELRGGRRALERFQDQQFTLQYSTMPRAHSKRPLLGDDSDESGSEYEGDRKPKKRSKIILGTRRSTRQASIQASRQASRQASIDNEQEEYDFDESNDLNQYENGDDDDQDDTKLSKHTRPASSTAERVTRSRNPALKNYNIQDDSDDELARDPQSDSEDDGIIPIVRSDLGPSVRKSTRKRKARLRHSSRRQLDSDSSIEFEPARRPRRSMATKSMRVPDPDDDYDMIEESTTNAPKHAATKETFAQLSLGSQFSKMHATTCDTCGAESGNGKGPLVYCQGCSYSYHKACIGVRAARELRVTKVGEDNFVLQCKYCIGVYQKRDHRAPKHSMCQTCKISGSSCAEFSTKKTPKQEEKARLDNGGEDPVTKVDSKLVNNADNVLFRCTGCRRAYHFEHLPALTSYGDDVKDIKDDRVQEYSLNDWKCKDCLETEHKIGGLVAWRPVNQDSYQVGQTCLDFGEDDIEYLVKWVGRSHFHDTWMPGAWIHGVAAHVMRTSFAKRDSTQFPKMDSKSAIEEEWLLADVLLSVRYRGRAVTTTKAQDLARIDNIESVLVKFQGLSYEEVVWDEPPPSDSGAPWDAFSAAYDEYLNGKYFMSLSDHKMRERIAQYRDLDFGKECELKSQPPHLTRGKLMEYQLEGVNYLLYNFHQQQNVILADEMGLGKTVQIVAFISSLVQDKPNCWPFLVVVPNSTCPNWRRELKQWAPDLRVVTYHGGKTAQDLAYRHELFPEGQKAGMKAHVVIMSYEAAANVKSVFNSVKWVGLIVDEGQRLKNEGTQLYRSLQDMNIPCRILLTGTPLQNNKRELFNLLQFIDPKQNAEELDMKYAELTKDNLPELHSIIRPYFLRRTKAQVLKFLPPMAQIILPVTMTVLQEKLSKSIISRNTSLIHAIVSKQRLKAGERKSLNNILSDLRQCLCHPFCFSADVEDKTVDAEQMHRNLVEASPKLLLLNIMLPKLKERGHRVLIFSQFLHSLTIIEDFLTGLGLLHERIDGNLSALEKQKRIDAFNAPDSPLFAMLLSTRAGGVGINLATADTVIIYDPDFNPHQDIQALSRAHRIGQKNKVLCFQLMTKSTVEEKIMQIGRKKMALDHALIESMDADEDAGEDLESILKHGAAALFSDESADKIIYDSASVDKLLDRSQIENTNTGDDQSAETQFSFARVWANNKGELSTDLADGADDDDAPAHPSIWENILKMREEEHQRELAAQQQEYGRGARRRGAKGVNYNSREPESGGSDVEEDELYIDNNEVEEEEYYESEGATAERAKTKGPKVGNLQDSQQNIPQNNSQNNPQDNPQKSTRRKHTASHPFPQASSRVQPQPQPPTMPLYQPQPPSMLPQAMPAPMGQGVTTPINPSNLVVYIPRRESPSSVQSIPGQMANPQPTRVLKSNTGTGQQPTRNDSGNWWVGGGNPCTICWRAHSANYPCINLLSEVSLRMALDSLRAGGDHPSIRASRELLTSYLRRLRGPNHNGQSM
ncbi:PHD/FYVE-zinc-finger like domain-containing protein [Biscogniauxia sp. FL1348]|nr:PHD/FYVE-zinc-finger like domain-containing protein [Biscogniauxia sp. FL1348]